MNKYILTIKVTVMYLFLFYRIVNIKGEVVWKMGLSRENISQRKLEGYFKWCDVIQWGRRNPTLFAEQFLGIEFMDYQRYAFQESWHKQFVIWLMSRNRCTEVSQLYQHRL